MAVDGAFRSDVPVFRALGRTEDQRRWLARLPSIVEEFERRWDVRTAAPFRSGSCAWVAPGETGDGRPVVLKAGWPHREAREEATALRHWHGDGAVLVYEAVPECHVLLLERCEPGTTLADAAIQPEDALVAAADVIVRLWAAPPPANSALELLGDVTAEWSGQVRERFRRYRPSFDPGLVEHGAALLESLPRTASRRVVVHGDFNPGNILAARRRPWLAIDAKPMVGDPAYDPEPLLAQVDPPSDEPNPATVIRHRYQLFADLVDEPLERLLAWGVARNVESALWSVSGGDLAEGTANMKHASQLATVLGT